MSTCRLDDVLASFDEHWQPRRVTAVNDHDVKVAKIQGEFIWHSHPDSDELFMLVEGDTLGGRYRVKAIAAETVELTDLVTGATRRLTLR